MNPGLKTFHVYIDDNACYMDESARKLHSVYSTYADAYRECRFIVEESVREFFDYAFTQEENFRLYILYGVSPWFDAQGEGRPFSAHEYARAHISDLFRQKPFLD